MKYENEDGCNKSDIRGSAEPFVKAPWLTRQFYVRTSIILVTGFIAVGAAVLSVSLQGWAKVTYRAHHIHTGLCAHVIYTFNKNVWPVTASACHHQRQRPDAKELLKDSAVFVILLAYYKNFHKIAFEYNFAINIPCLIILQDNFIG